MFKKGYNYNRSFFELKRTWKGIVMIYSGSVKSGSAAPKLQKIKDNLKPDNPREISLADSFVKNTAEITPVLLGAAAITGYAKSLSKGQPFKENMKNILKGKFVPLLLGISTVSAVLENYLRNIDTRKCKKAS